MARQARLVRGVFTVGFWTLVSRVLGFCRDVIFAAVLGTGPTAEAFLVAFSLPNMFRRIFAEGAFNTAFVPMFSKRLQTGRDPLGFAEEAFSGLAGFLVIFFVAAQVLVAWENHDIGRFFGRSPSRGEGEPRGAVVDSG